MRLFCVTHTHQKNRDDEESRRETLATTSRPNMFSALSSFEAEVRQKRREGPGRRGEAQEGEGREPTVERGTIDRGR